MLSLFIPDINRMIFKYLNPSEKKNVMRLYNFHIIYDYEDLNYAIIYSHICTVDRILSTHNNYFYKYDCCMLSVRHNNEYMLNYAIDNGCYRTSVSCKEAAKNGNEGMLRYLVSKKFLMDESVIIGAAFHGHLHIIKWAVKNGCPCGNQIYKYAACGDHIHIVLWAYENGYECPEELPNMASQHGALKVFNWAIICKECTFDPMFCLRLACYYGHLNIMKALEPFIIYTPPIICTENGIKNGSIEILKWMKKNNFNWNTECFCAPIKQGNIEAIKWIHENIHPLTKEDLSFAQFCDQQEIISLIKDILFIESNNKL